MNSLIKLLVLASNIIPINVALQFHWLLYASVAIPRIQACDTRPLLLVRAGWGLGMRSLVAQLEMRVDNGNLTHTIKGLTLPCTYTIIIRVSSTTL